MSLVRESACECERDDHDDIDLRCSGPLPATHVELRRRRRGLHTLLRSTSVRFGSLRFASVHRSFVLFWLTVAGRKLLLDGKRGPAIEGGNLGQDVSGCRVQTCEWFDSRAHFGIPIILMRDPSGGIGDIAAFKHAPNTGD